MVDTIENRYAPVMTDQRADDALTHIDGATAALGGFVALMVVLGVLSTIFSSGTMLGVGSSSICTEVQPGVYLPFGGDDDGAGDGSLGLAKDARESVASTRICAEDPTAGARALSLLDPLGDLVMLGVVLLLVRRWIRAARRDGLFAPGVATRLSHVGKALVVAAGVTCLLGIVSTNAVVAAAVDGPYTWKFSGVVTTFPWLLLVVGIGVTSLARVTAYGRLLQQDVDGLV